MGKCPALVHALSIRSTGRRSVRRTRPPRRRLVWGYRWRSLDTALNEKELARAGEATPPGHGRLQLRYKTGLTGERYVRARAWRDARLECCPNHPHGGCSLARHGTYARKTPRGTRVARWYCPESHTTFSLLPDCLAARLPGTLDEVEAVVAHAEQAPSQSAAADALRRDLVGLAGAIRWVRRRVRLVHHALILVIGLLPEPLERCAAEVGAVRARLGTDRALVALRALSAAQLPVLPAPLGFHPRRRETTIRNRRLQHKMGPDPPAPSP